MTLSISFRDPLPSIFDDGDLDSQPGKIVSANAVLVASFTGRVVDIAGVSRRVTAIDSAQSPAVLTYSGTPLSGTGVVFAIHATASRIRPRISLTSDNPQAPVAAASLNVYLNGARVISPGGSPHLSADGRSQAVVNAFLGFDVTIVPAERLADGDRCTLRVVADDTQSSSPIDETWLFAVVDDLGPRVSNTSDPAPFSRKTTSPATIDIDVVDNPETHLVDFAVTGANVEFAPPLPLGPGTPANQIQFDVTANPGASFEGRVGRRLKVGASTYRRLVSIQGPGLATYDGAQLAGTSVSAEVFLDKGLDVVVDGVSVIRQGLDETGGSWSPVVTPGPGVIQVSMSPPITWSTGTRVPVSVRATDADGNVHDLDYDFVVGQAEGPVVSNISPSPATRGVAVGPSPASDLSFDVTSVHGVNSSTLNVLVDGTAAVSAGVGVGSFSTSTVTGISGGFSVTLKNSGNYADGRVVHVDVSCDDSLGNVGERRVWSVQFGTSTAAQAATVGGGELTSDAVVRVVAYDLSETSFARPVELGHTGFAADGLRYVDGAVTADVASWHTELGDFPVSGQFVVTGDGGWLILEPLAPTPWISCPQLPSGSGWSMAGHASSPLLDGDFSRHTALAAVASALGLVSVDFTVDRAVLLDVNGRVTSVGDISSRASNQSGALPDTSLALSVSTVEKVALGDVVGDMFLAQPGLVTAVVTSSSPATVRSDAMPLGTVWSRLVSDSGGGSFLFAGAYTVSGQGAVAIWRSSSMTAGAGAEELYDDLSSPSLPASESVNDLALSGSGLFVASDSQLTVINRPLASSQAFSLSDLGLTGTGSLSAVSIEPGTLTDTGHVYTATDSPGRVTRFRLHSPSAANRAVTLSNGAPVVTVSAAGSVRVDTSSFIRSSMEVV